MAEFVFRDMLETAHAHVPWRKLTADFVSSAKFDGNDILKVEAQALTLLSREAFVDIAHLLRPGHLAQMRAILDDAEASANDKFVVYDLLKNVCISAGRVLPMCQDTGNAIVMGKKGQQVWTGYNDAEAIARGVWRSYGETNLR
jgi:fumarate hydratase class I